MISSYARGGLYLRRKLGSHKSCSYTPETIQLALTALIPPLASWLDTPAPRTQEAAQTGRQSLSSQGSYVSGHLCYFKEENRESWF